MASDHHHIIKQFDVELRLLKDKILYMASVVEEHIALAMRALGDRDIAGAERVERGDPQVNLLEMEVDETCVRLLALRQPAAGDLRFIAAALKIVTDLERMGDLAVNIAERAEDLARSPTFAPAADDVRQIGDAVQRMLKDALDAFVDRDVARAEALLERDDEIDELFRAAFRTLVERMKADPAKVEAAVSTMFIAKHLERIADHATNIAEMVVYFVQGKDVRHKLSVEAQGRKRA